MNVKITEINYEKSWDFVSSLEIDTPENNLSFHDGEIEDNILGRNFSDTYNIKDLIKEAYLAGKTGEELNIDIVEVDSYEKAVELGLD